MFDPDTPGNAHRCRALFNVILHCPTSINFFFVADFQYIVNTNHSNFEYAPYVLNIAFYIGPKKVGVGSYFLSRQHAGEGSHHSSRDCTDYVIQSSSVLFYWINLVKFLYSAMYPIEDRLREAFYLSYPDRAPVSRDRDT